VPSRHRVSRLCMARWVDRALRGGSLVRLSLQASEMLLEESKHIGMKLLMKGNAIEAWSIDANPGKLLRFPPASTAQEGRSGVALVQHGNRLRWKPVAGCRVRSIRQTCLFQVLDPNPQLMGSSQPSNVPAGKTKLGPGSTMTRFDARICVARRAVSLFRSCSTRAEVIPFASSHAVWRAGFRQ